MLPSDVPRLTKDSPVSVFWCLETSLFLKSPFLGWISIPTSFVSFFVFYIFSYFLSKAIFSYPSFLLFWVPDILCRHSEVISRNLLRI